MIAEPVTAGFLILAPVAAGLSDDANLISTRIEECRESFDTSITFLGSRQETAQNLMEAFSEAREPGWDGYDAVPVSLATFEASYRYADALPPDIPAPDVSAEPDGELAFTWRVGPSRFYSVSVGPNNRVAYAAMNGSSEWFGGDTFFDQVPAKVLSDLRSVLGG